MNVQDEAFAGTEVPSSKDVLMESWCRSCSNSLATKPAVVELARALDKADRIFRNFLSFAYDDPARGNARRGKTRELGETFREHSGPQS